MTNLRDLPPVPPSLDEGLERLLRRLREEVQNLQGWRSDGTQRALTQADGGSSTVVVVGGGTGGGGGGTTPELTPPPSPSALAIVAGITQVTLTWSGIGYTQGHGHKQTIIYAVKRDPASTAPDPVFADAVMVATAPNALTVISIPSEPNTKWYAWARFETNDGMISVVPAGGTNGVQATTGQDVAQLLAILAGQITEAQLYAALGDRINLIDGASSLPGSVNARVLSEATNRIAGDEASAALVTLLQAKFEGAGSNIVPYGGVDYDADSNGLADGWQVFVGGAGDAPRVHSVALQSALVGDGKSQRLAIVGPVGNAQDSGLTTLERFPIRPSTQYTASVFVQSNTTSVFFQIRVFTASGLVADATDFASSPVAAANTLERLKITFTTPADAVDCTVLVRGLTLVGHSLNMDGVVVQQGSVATPYAPSAALVASAFAAVRTEETTRASETGALASSITTLSAAVGANSAAISTETTARVTLDGAVHALYTMRVQATAGGRTVVGGFGLAATPNAAGGPEIEMGVRADRFWIGAPSGTTGVGDILPFVVQTTDETVNGVVIPRGVYMDAAYIKNLTALVARLGLAWIDNAMIANLSASKLTVGDGTVGGDLKSTGYVSGSAGWRIRPDGSAEFSGVVVRGTIFANAGTFGGITIGSADVRSTGYVPGASGFRINADGGAEFYNVTVRGHVEAMSGLFQGDVSVNGATYGNSVTGFWTGIDAGVAKLRVGSATSYMRWTGSNLEIVNATFTAPSFTPFTATVTGYNTSVFTGAPRNLGTRGVTLANGSPGYTYQWSLEDVVWSDESGGPEWWFNGFVSNGATVALMVQLIGGTTTLTAKLKCVVVDSSGRTAIAIAPVFVNIA